tara:strand:+ start:387 stop:584 length:198 start_codon:yes stop_codon:yes gene_type:complete
MKKILETPSLESVEEHFKGVTSVYCLVTSGIESIQGNEIEFAIDCYWIGSAKVWSCSQGYAKIIK